MHYSPSAVERESNIGRGLVVKVDAVILCCCRSLFV